VTTVHKQLTRYIEDSYQRDMLIKLLKEQVAPYTVTITRGKRRSTSQNRLNRLWAGEISEQLGDQTPEEVRGLLKLQFAVPILRAENEAFAEAYDRVVKPLPYETKLALMCEPIDLPATRLLTTAQEHRYLNTVYQFFTAKGVVLTVPPDKRFGPADAGTLARNAEQVA
jgi:hypothetical protein